ncbi:stress-responsive transcription factor hsf1 [Basidiobolus ranarum]|uniref:Stress-responsive transcription factor hsf1 n=1 Tax=Basidiobolus ranarum TaxID=34480 RepID=A0ABR2VTQ1_9FUNG
MIAWEPSGNRFVIKDPVKLAAEVLPQYYDTNKLTSFTRQLNIYGFYRVSDRRTKKCSHSLMTIYLHRYFRRDQPNEHYLVQRVKNPYSRTKVSSLIPEAGASTIAKPVCTEVSVEHCLNCSLLRQEIELMSKLLKYYTSLVNELAILDTPENESSLSLQTPITSDFQEIELSDSSLLFSTDVPPFLDISVSLTSNYDPILYPNNYSHASSLVNTSLLSKTGTF